MIVICINNNNNNNNNNNAVLTYSLLTPWCRVLLEKLTGLQLVKKFPAFYGTRRFITALTSVRHLNNAIANNNYGRLQDIILLFRILMGT